MKIFLTFLGFLIIYQAKSQESYRIEKFPKIFHGAFSGNFQKRINDSLTLKVVTKKPNYEMSVIRDNGTVACSCLYKLNPTDEIVGSGAAGDSTLRIKVLQPVNDNCLAKYRFLVNKRLQN